MIKLFANKPTISIIMKVHLMINNVLNINEYSTFEEIDKSFYDNIIYINCHNHKLNNINFITLLPNLIKLVASKNNLTDIPNHDNLEYLDINTNKLNKLGHYPKLIKLFAFRNFINSLIISDKMEEIDISNNLLHYVHINKRNNLKKLIVSYNKLTDINKLYLMKKLEYIDFYENPIILPEFITKTVNSNKRLEPIKEII